MQCMMFPNCHHNITNCHHYITAGKTKYEWYQLADACFIHSQCDSKLTLPLQQVLKQQYSGDGNDTSTVVTDKPH